MKKSRSKWLKKFLVIGKDAILYVYSDHTKTKEEKRINIKKDVSSVWFHYHPKAPVQSNKLGEKDRDESRFDVYLKQPKNKRKMFKIENKSQIEADDWVSTIQEDIPL